MSGPSRSCPQKRFSSRPSCPSPAWPPPSPKQGGTYREGAEAHFCFASRFWIGTAISRDLPSRPISKEKRNQESNQCSIPSPTFPGQLPAVLRPSRNNWGRTISPGFRAVPHWNRFAPHRAREEETGSPARLAAPSKYTVQCSAALYNPCPSHPPSLLHAAAPTLALFPRSCCRSGLGRWLPDGRAKKAWVPVKKTSPTPTVLVQPCFYHLLPPSPKRIVFHNSRLSCFPSLLTLPHTTAAASLPSTPLHQQTANTALISLYTNLVN